MEPSMRILLCGSKMNMVSGHSRPAFELMSQLSAMGHEVRLFSTTIDKPGFREVNASLIQHHNRLNDHRSEDNIIYRYNTKELAFKDEAAGFIEEQLAWCDVVHTFSILTGSLIARISRRRVRRPVMFTLASNYGLTWHDLGLPFLQTGWVSIARPGIGLITFAPHILYRKLMESFDLVHSWTQYMASKAVRWGISADRVATTPIGVDLRACSRSLKYVKLRLLLGEG